MMDVFEHLAQPQEVLNNLYSLLPNKGILYINTILCDSSRLIDQLVTAIIAEVYCDYYGWRKEKNRFPWHTRSGRRLSSKDTRGITATVLQLRSSERHNTTT